MLAPSSFAIDPYIKINDLNDNIVYLENSLKSVKIDNFDDDSKKIVQDAILDLNNIKK